MLHKSALVRARKSVESLYDSTALIYTFASVRDEETGQMITDTSTVCEQQPCRVSLKTDNSAIDMELYKDKKQIIKLFLAPEIVVPVGSTAEITKDNVTKKYKNSGEPFVYDTHQEIIFETE